MIAEFVARFEAAKPALREAFKKAPEDYTALVKTVIEVLKSETDNYGDSPDPDRIHKVDDGNYQGTLVFVIGSDGYQPNTYWYVKVSYGSCSGCDTLQAINGYSGDESTEEQIDDYMTLALHVVQGLKRMGDDE